MSAIACSVNPVQLLNRLKIYMQAQNRNKQALHVLNQLGEIKDFEEREAEFDSNNHCRWKIRLFGSQGHLVDMTASGPPVKSAEELEEAIALNKVSVSSISISPPPISPRHWKAIESL